jgi:hypothetical protein
MKPTWWQLYGLAVLLVALIGAIEVGVPPGALRTTLESAAVVLGFGLMLVWRRHNRVALELATQAARPNPPQPLEWRQAPGATLGSWVPTGQTPRRSWPESRRRKRVSVEES